VLRREWSESFVVAAVAGREAPPTAVATVIGCGGESRRVMVLCCLTVNLVSNNGGGVPRF
jgi:hypothetical protein